MHNLLKLTRRPDITFYPSGRILITARIANILNITPGDSINIAIIDGESLLHVIPKGLGRRRAVCFPSKKGGRSLCCNSVALCQQIFNISKVSPQKTSFLAGDILSLNGKPFIPIITGFPIISPPPLK
ncbi:MAG: hypothetical protein J1D77_03610 [Muribaculaceae bacterium]|nr:hypothetical protein [Muribaculaceae bacterium]